MLAESMDQAHLVEAIDGVLRRLGGTPREWRTDRLATVIVPGSGAVQPSFAPVAKHVIDLDRALQQLNVDDLDRRESQDGAQVARHIRPRCPLEGL